MTRLLGLLLIISAWLLPGEQAQATNCGTGTGTCFVLGVGGNWNNTATWGNSTGGGACTCTPATGDFIFTDANSGASTINANITIAGLDATGFTGTLTHSSGITVTVNGNDASSNNPSSGTYTVKLVSGMTYTLGNPVSSAWSFAHSTGGAVTTIMAGKTANAFGSVTENITDAANTAKLTFGDAFFTQNSGAVTTLTDGVFDTGSQNITLGSLSSSNANSRTINLNSSTVTLACPGNCAILDFTTNTSLTLSAGTSTVAINSAATGFRNFFPNGKTFNAVTVTDGGTGKGSLRIGNSSFSMASLTLTGPVRVQFDSTFTYTITSSLTFNGGASNSPVLVQTGITDNSTVATFSCTGATATGTWVVIRSFTASGCTPTFTSSVDGGGNTGFTISGPTGGGGGKIIGGYLLRRDLNLANDNRPLWLNEAA